MATYKTPEDIAEEYLLYLKSLKPNVNTKQTDSDWWIRSRVVGGVLSGVYADQLKISNDAFPQSARREALEKSLYTYFGTGFTNPTQAKGNVLVTAAATGTPALGINTQFQFDPNGNIYLSTASVSFVTAVTGIVPVTSVGTGQNQNLLEGAILSLPSPPAGILPTATVYGGNISDGRDVEKNEEASSRVLRQIRTPLAGGKVSDYERFALDADPSVTKANVIRYAFGFGTIGLVVTAGTTDIDAAIDAGADVVQIPSADLVAKVQTYVNTQNPETDCATVLTPAPVTQAVTVKVKFSSGTGATILSGQTLTQTQLVQREVKRALYKTPPGGRRLGSTGYVVCSDIEEVLDFNLSASPYTIGAKAQILLDRQVSDLSASGANRAMLGNEIVIPGTITVIEL